MMNRRAFVTGLGAVLAAPLAVWTQPAGKVWRIGLLGGSSPTTPEAARPWEALLQGLRELGYVEGQNLAVERRWAEGRAERYQELAAELVVLKPDVIVAATTPSVSAAKRATSTIPIVMTLTGDPVGVGLIASLARPGRTSPECRFRTAPSWRENGWNCSRKPSPACVAWACS